jgi:small Trp-rich protein
MAARAASANSARFIIEPSMVELQSFNAIVRLTVDPVRHENFGSHGGNMLFLGLGVVLLLMKYLELGPVAAWSWWVVLTPFALAVAWWTWADWSGYTKRKAVERENARKQARIDKNREQLGLGTRKSGRR